MRPIIKQTPTDEQGNLVTFSKYDDAKPFLVNQLGDYCSFCEKQNTRSALEVEHIYPKSKGEYAHLINEWSNFLLGCKICNSIKGAKEISLTNTYMPHTDNLMCYIEILEGGFIQIKPNLLQEEKEKATAFINLIGLDRSLGHPNYSYKDDRWEYRYKAYEYAQECLNDYQNSQHYLKNIINLAKTIGFFSVWFTVFHAHDEVKSALINAFAGTAANCFDENNHFAPIPR
jgi:hypothetical protein